MSATLHAPTDSAPVQRQESALLVEARRPARRAALAHRLIARILLGALAVQLFFAGLGVFGLATFQMHIVLGTAIVLGSFALPVLAWRGRLDRGTTRLSWLLAGLMMLQGALIDVGRVVHVVSAFHPVNAMLLILVTFTLAGRDASF